MLTEFSKTLDVFGRAFGPKKYFDAERVYFMRDGDRIKIGRSRHPDERLKQVAGIVGVDPRVRLLGSIPGDCKLESSLHRRFRHLRVRGEWFDSGPDLLEFIASLGLGGK